MEVVLNEIQMVLPDDYSGPRGSNGFGYNKHEEKSMISFSNACVKPRTVVIKFTDTSITILTVSCPEGLLETCKKLVNTHLFYHTR